jgi:hypothetical protein
MKKWQRPKPCWCSGYWFPHRKGGGACDHNPNEIKIIKLRAKQRNEHPDVTMNAIIDYIWDHKDGPRDGECPF